MLGRFSRRRLEAEAIRDSLLAAAGRLDRRLGGPASLDFNLPRRTLYCMTVRSDRTSFRELFRGPVRRITLLTLTVCALTLTAHWAFVFWNVQQLRGLP